MMLYEMESPSLFLYPQFRGKERIEYTLQIAIGNARAGVGNGRYKTIARSIEIVSRCGYSHKACFMGIHGVADEIQKDLLQLEW